ncbi:MAG: aldehyde dehydrogenase family protein, partial [Anaerolineae bacterium]
MITDTSQAEHNLNRAAELRGVLAERGVRHIINGEHVDAATGSTFEATSPIDNTVICTVAEGGAEDIDRAVQAAQAAFPAWRDMKAKTRRDLLYRVAELIEENAEEIALLETLDTGQPIRFMSMAAIRAAANFRFFADRVV